MGTQFLYPRSYHLKVLPIDFSGSGDNTIVSAVANNRIVVHRIWFVAGTAGNLIFKSGASTAISGTVPISANGGITFDATGEPWFVTALGEAFVINSSAGGQTGGMIYYALTT